MRPGTVLVAGRPPEPGEDPGRVLVFTTVRLLPGGPRWWSDHARRLSRDAEAFGLAAPPWAEVERHLADGSVPVRGLLVRIGLTARTWVLAARPVPAPDRDPHRHGLPAIVTGHRVPTPLARHKVGARAPWDAALREARRRGAWEALVMDEEGRLVDGSRTSPLLWAGKRLVVPEGGLPGITRRHVIDRARTLGIPVETRPVAPGELAGAELLLAGTGVGLVPAAPPRSPEVRALLRAFREFTPGAGEGSSGT